MSVVVCISACKSHDIFHTIIRTYEHVVVGGLEHFPHIQNNHPSWLVFFRGVETTNQWYIFFLVIKDHHWLKTFPWPPPLPSRRGNGKRMPWFGSRRGCRKEDVEARSPGDPQGSGFFFMDEDENMYKMNRSNLWMVDAHGFFIMVYPLVN